MDFSQIDAIVTENLKNGTTNADTLYYLEKIDDPETFSFARQVLSGTEYSDNLAFYSLKVIDRALLRESYSWNVDYFLEISEWMLLIFYNQIDRYISSEYLFRIFVKTYSNLVKLGWHISSQFQNFFLVFQHFFEGSNHHLAGGLALCAGIVEEITHIHKLDTAQLAQFKQTTMLNCFLLAIDTLKRVCNVGSSLPANSTSDDVSMVIQYSLDLIRSCLSSGNQPGSSFSNDNDNLKIEKFVVDIPQNWTDFSLFSDLVVLIYTIYCQNFLQKECLQILTYVAAIKSRERSQNDTVQIFENLNNVIIQIITTNLTKEDSDVVYNLILLVVRTNISIFPIAIKFENYPNLVSAVGQLTSELLTTDQLNNNDDIILNIFKFWFPIINNGFTKNDDNNPFDEFLDITQQITKQYYLLINSYIEENVKTAVQTIFPDNTLKNVPPLIEEIAKMGYCNVDEFYPYLFQESEALISTFAANPTDPIIEAKLCVYHTSFVVPINTKKYVQYSCQSHIINFIIFTQSFLSQNTTGPLLCEQVVIFLINQLYKKIIQNNIGQCMDLPQEVYAETNLRTTFDLISLALSRLFLSLRIFAAEPEIVASAIDVLREFTETADSLAKNYIYQILLGENDQPGLVNFEDMDSIAFIGYPKNKHSRFVFFKILGSILNNHQDHPKMEQLIESINQRFVLFSENPDEAEGQGLLIDIRGFFNSTTVDANYQFFFNWFYPDYIAILQDSVKQFPSLLIPFLKFLNEFVNNTKSRISFHQHSANGLKMFKTAAQTLIYFFTETSPTSEEKKGLTYAMKIMELILNDKFSNIGALEVYQDPILNDLFEAFLKYMAQIDILPLLMHQKTLVVLICLLNCVFRFIDYFLKIDQSFILAALKICSQANSTYEQVYMVKTYQVIGWITDYLVANQDNPVVAQLIIDANPIYDEILFMLEGIIFSSDATSKLQYQVLSIMTNVVKMHPPSWPQVRHKLSLFLQNIKTSKDKSYRQEISECMTQLLELDLSNSQSETPA